MDRKKMMWFFLSILIAAFSIWAVVAQNKNFSYQELLSFLEVSHKGWLFGALICMFGFIWFEGCALLRVACLLGFKRKVWQGTEYGAADVYFSAITPSASGGQPASAYFMMKDGMSATATTTALLINLVMYTLALLCLGLLCFFAYSGLFAKFSIFSKLLIVIGGVVLIILGLGFYLLLCRGELLYKIADAMLRLLEKLHLLHNGKRKREKLNRTMKDYKDCAIQITGHSRVLIELFLLNILQRASQLGVSFMIFMAMGSGIKKACKIWALQCFVAVGSNSVPIPGSMGVADYLMLDGLKTVVGEQLATTMELLCRGITFYGCMITSSLIVLFGYFRRMRRKKC